MSESSFSQKPPEALQPGDYYFDPNGLMVLTEQYLKRRGSCCKNGCRHCPYGFFANHGVAKERSSATDDYSGC